MRIIIFITITTLFLPSFSFATQDRCRDLFGHIAFPVKRFAEKAHSQGVISLAVPFPIRHLPELMNGNAVNTVPTGYYPIREDVVGFYPILKDEMNPQQVARMLSIREPWEDARGKSLGDNEHVVLLFSVHILDHLDWDAKGRTTLPLIKKPNYENGVRYKRSDASKFSDLEVWAQPDSPFVLATFDEITIDHVSGIWVHPKKRNHFKQVWLEGYAKSRRLDYDFNELSNRVVFLDTQPTELNPVE